MKQRADPAGKDIAVRNIQCPFFLIDFEPGLEGYLDMRPTDNETIL